MAWIETIEPDDATGRLREEYERASRRAGRVAGVLKISSLAPDILGRWVDVYLAVMFGPSSLTRVERELAAVVVSHANDCHY